MTLTGLQRQLAGTPFRRVVWGATLALGLTGLCLTGLCLTGTAAQAQGYGQDGAYAPVPPPPPPPPPANLAGLFASLTDEPGNHSGFVFDKNMLQLAQGALESNGVDPHRAAAAITGISFDTYHYSQPAFYNPEGMAAVLASYHAAGWKHLVNANQTPQNTAQPRNTVTDLWLHFAGMDIDGVTVLTRSAKTMNVVQINGDLRPADLLHLSGHFGIPKVDPGAVMVPAPDGR